MAFYGGFPASYQTGYTPGYPGAQMPVYGPQNAYQGQNIQAQPQPQQMTPPTIRAEIVQVEGEEAAKSFPVGAGTSQMMISRDETAIFIKSATTNGQTVLDVYEKRPPAPPAPVFDPSEYVRRDEVERLVAAALAAQTATKKSTTKAEKVEAD